MEKNLVYVIIMSVKVIDTSTSLKTENVNVIIFASNGK